MTDFTAQTWAALGPSTLDLPRAPQRTERHEASLARERESYARRQAKSRKPFGPAQMPVDDARLADLVKRGKKAPTIAYALGVSESTARRRMAEFA